MISMEDKGKAFVALGRALQDPGANMRELADLALECGLTLQFRLSPKEPAESPDNGGCSGE